MILGKSWIAVLFSLTIISSQATPLKLAGALDRPGPAPKALMEVEQALNADDIVKARSLLDTFLSNTSNNSLAWEMDAILRSLQGNLDDAVVSLQKSAALSPGATSPLIKIGIIKLTQGNSEEARRYFQDVLGLEPSNLAAHSQLARLDKAEGDDDSARLHYVAASAQVPDLAQIHLDHAELLLHLNQHSQVVELLRPFAERGNGIPSYVYSMGSAYVGLENVHEARRMLDRLEALDPSHKGLTVLQGMVSRSEGDYRTSEAIFREMLSSGGDIAQVRYQLGLTLTRAEKYDRAIEEFEMAVKNSEVALAARLEIGRALILSGQLERGIGNLEETSKLFKDPAVDQFLATMYAKRGDRELALKTAEQLTRQYPQHAPGFLMYASFQNASGNSAGALVTLRRGLSNNPRDLSLQLSAAAIHQTQGQLAEAEAIYQDLVVSLPGRVDVLNNLAVIKASLRKPEQAFEYASRAHELAPQSAMVMETYGWAMHLNGDHEKAKETLQDVVRLLPSSADALCHLGLVYAALDEEANAQRALEKCLTLEPTTAIGDEAIAALSLLRS